MAGPRQRPCAGARGLSLVEVLVAVALCAGAVLAVVALFGPTERALRDATDRRTAIRLVERVEAELQRVGFTTVAAVLAEGAELELVARSDGAQVVPAAEPAGDPATDAARGIPAAERYFHIKVSRAVRPSPSPAVIILEIRVGWPWRAAPDGTPAPDPQRAELCFHTALNR